MSRRDRAIFHLLLHSLKQPKPGVRRAQVSHVAQQGLEPASVWDAGVWAAGRCGLPWPALLVSRRAPRHFLRFYSLLLKADVLSDTPTSCDRKHRFASAPSTQGAGKHLRGGRLLPFSLRLPSGKFHALFPWRGGRSAAQALVSRKASALQGTGRGSQVGGPRQGWRWPGSR